MSWLVGLYQKFEFFYSKIAQELATKQRSTFLKWRLQTSRHIIQELQQRGNIVKSALLTTFSLSFLFTILSFFLHSNLIIFFCFLGNAAGEKSILFFSLWIFLCRNRCHILKTIISSGNCHITESTKIGFQHHKNVTRRKKRSIQYG